MSVGLVDCQLFVTAIDASTKKPVAGASMTVVDSKNKVVKKGQTNNLGIAVFTVGKGSYSIQSNAGGYQAKTEQLNISAHTTVTINLVPG